MAKSCHQPTRLLWISSRRFWLIWRSVNNSIVCNDRYKRVRSIISLYLRATILYGIFKCSGIAVVKAKLEFCQISGDILR